MKYIVRDGIVKMNICGVVFLTPTRKQSAYCSAIMPLNLFSTMIWNSFVKGKEIQEIYELFMKLNISSDQAKQLVDKYIQDFIRNGYIIEV